MVTFTCYSGYEIYNGSITSTCQNGQWSSDPPFCTGIIYQNVDKARETSAWKITHISLLQTKIITRVIGNTTLTFIVQIIELTVTLWFNSATITEFNFNSPVLNNIFNLNPIPKLNVNPNRNLSPNPGSLTK